MPRHLPRQALLLGLALSASLALAAMPLAASPLAAQGAPAGTWHTISDVDGRPRGIITLRGYVGIALLGRSQRWVRAPF